MCGENRSAHHADGFCKGSPPRVRGKPLLGEIACGEPRITPACAGKTAPRSPCIYAGGDHPRVCGENCTSRPAQRPERGSPPRVRGKLHKRGLLRGSLGITPACAGKTALSQGRGPASWDHPRVCGENRLRFFSPRGITGSPPRVRGKPLPRPA